MKKAVKISIISLLSILMLGIIVSTIFYSNYWAEDKYLEISEENLSYFHETYTDCRSSFLKGAKEVSEIYDSVQIGKFFVESKVDTDLTVDWCYIPAQVHNNKLLIINSGLHGIEGYTGSAIQKMFIKKILPKSNLDSVGVLFIHGINPYGFKYYRKVTENNVDLNRNCVIETKMYSSKNEGYKKLKPMLMPKGEVSLGNLRNRFFHLMAIAKIIKESMPVLRQAALQGQYEFEKGIYYGGEKYEPQIELLKPFLKEKMEAYNIVLNLDLHTAYGERGKLHLFINPIDDKKISNAIATVFAGTEIDWGSGEDFYTINGEYIGWANSLTNKVMYIPMLFEFGTLDSQETFGSLKSIQVMINENQGVHCGFKNSKHKTEAKRLFNEMYYPSSPAWRSKVINDSYNQMTSMIQKFEKL